MLDMSGSMTGNIPTLRQAAVQMFTRLLPDDKARDRQFRRSHHGESDVYEQRQTS